MQKMKQCLLERFMDDVLIISLVRWE